MELDEMRVLTDADLKNIQGIIISGCKHLKRTAYLFLQFEDIGRAPEWIRAIIPYITTADWRKFLLYDEKPPYAVNLAFTHAGITVLKKEIRNFSQEFEEGINEANRSRRLGDEGSSSPENWDLNCQPAHVLLILQAPDTYKLDDLINKYQTINAQYGVKFLFESQYGYIRQDAKEHFGFTDSISQPFIENSPASKKNTETSIRAGEFILGYTNGYDQFPSTPFVDAAKDVHNVLPRIQGREDSLYHDFGFNGSYLVFRKLYQSVYAFHNYFKTQLPEQHDRDLAAAKCFGRWPSGAPLVSARDRDNPALKEKNDFNFSKDRFGESCPVGSHIRRANPRDTLSSTADESWTIVNRHRILRRGTLYGDPFDGDRPDEKDRGLYFICLNADIRRQFEFVQQTWLNNTKFGDLYSERDPIAGNNLDSQPQQGAEYFVTLPSASLRKRFEDFPRVVTVKGGGYFFLPSIPALHYLAGIPNQAQKEPSVLHPLEKAEKNETKLIYSLAGMLKSRLIDDYPPGKTKRDFHVRSLGLLKATFKISDDIAPDLRTGVFSHPGREYKAWIRISSSDPKNRSDKKKDMRGFALKLIGVEENNENVEAGTQDFILLSRPNMPLGTIGLTQSFIKAGQEGSIKALKFLVILLIVSAALIVAFFWITTFPLSVWRILLLIVMALLTVLSLTGVIILLYTLQFFPHPLAAISNLIRGARALTDLFFGFKRIASPLDVRYWSTTPWQCGKQVVKFSAVPTSAYKSEKPGTLTDTYLTDNMVKHLSRTGASFDFKMQLFKNQKTTPVENAAIEWKESDSPFVKVATITISIQDFNIPQRIDMAEIISLNPRNTSAEIRPLGGLNRARTVIYDLISKFRHHRNGRPQVRHSVKQYDAVP